jgi:hypothetical protein
MHDRNDYFLFIFMTYLNVDVLYDIMPLLVAVFFVIQYLVGFTSPYYNKSFHYFLITVYYAILSSFVYLIFADLIVYDFDPVRVGSVVGVFIVVFLFWIIRSFLKKRKTFEHYSSFVDSLSEFVLLSIAYLSSISGKVLYSYSGIEIAIIFTIKQIMRMRYRIYDEIFVARTDFPKSEISIKHAFARDLLDRIPSVWLNIAYCFSIINLNMVVKIGGNNGADLTGVDYIINYPTSSRLADFLYFNIVTMATVGYGDIIPVSISARLLCVLQILISIFILSSLIQLLWGNYQNANK